MTIDIHPLGSGDIFYLLNNNCQSHLLWVYIIFHFALSIVKPLSWIQKASSLNTPLADAIAIQLSALHYCDIDFDLKLVSSQVPNYHKTLPNLLSDNGLN